MSVWYIFKVSMITSYLVSIPFSVICGETGVQYGIRGFCIGLINFGILLLLNIPK